MESPKEGVFVSKRDNNTDSVADGLLHDIRFDIRNLTHYLTQLSDEAETRGMEAAQEAVTHRNGIDETPVKLRKCTSKQINGLDGKVDTIQKTLDTMIDQLQKDITREITSKLTSKLRDLAPLSHGLLRISPLHACNSQFWEQHTPPSNAP